MDNTVRCLYCGAEMQFDSDSCHVWMRCDACLACSPKVERMTYTRYQKEYPFSYVRYWARCRELAEEAARRRPLRVPMTLNEANKCEDPVWIEFRNFSEANGWRAGMYDALHWASRVYADMSAPEFGADYRTWLCRPTGEECAAAAWEEKHVHRDTD